VLAAAVALSASNCQRKGTPTNDGPPVSLSVTPAGPITLNVGQTAQIAASTTNFAPPGPSVTYSSSTPSVATVSATGLVTCAGAGTTTITVRAAGVDSSGATHTLDSAIQVICSGTAPTPSGEILQVTPATLSFSHTVGTTACPQSIGPLHLSTQRNENVSVTLAVSGTSALNLGQATATLGPSGSADVGVNFNCSTQTNFHATIVLNATSPTTSGTVSVPVTSSIK